VAKDINMEKAGFLPLIYNASLLISLILIYTLNLQISKKLLKPHNSIILGFYLGLIGVFIMLTPWQLSPGYLFDTRSVLLALSGLYFGLIPTLIAMLMTAVMRLIDGGGGVVVGTILVFTSGFIGLIWRKVRHISLENISFRELFLLGLIVHVVMLALMSFLPSVKMTFEVVSNIALPVLLVFPIVLALLGTFLSKILRDQFALDERLKNEFLFQSQFDLGNIGMSITLPDQSWLRVNPRLIEMLGYSEKELQSLTWADLTHPEDLDKHLVKFNEIITGDINDYELDKRFLHKDGSIVYTHLTVSCYRNQGEIEFFIAALLDVTKSKQAEEELKLAASVFTHAGEAIAITDATAIIIDVNDTFTAITGYSREEVIGKNPRILQSGRQSPEFYVDMWQTLLKEGYWSGELWNRRKNGEVYAEMKTISAVRDTKGVLTHYVALSTDITPMKEHQDQLEHIARYDRLTNLPNRSLLADRLSQAMLQCSRHKQSLAVVFLDLDGFKEVNDGYGHDVGDELLIALSLRMKEALREGDTIARIGGDEFVAVLADLVKVEDCEPVLERLLLSASEPVTIGDMVLNISASIGVTLYPQDSVDADMLLRHADQAMYVAKGSGKNRYHLFDTAQDEAVKVQHESLKAIRTALDEHQFVLYYQPKVNMRTESVMGVEALIRWQHPIRGLLNPLEFLPVIENHTMMIEMGEWVIDTALTQISQWQAMGLNQPINTSVNIAAVQLARADFADRLAALLAAHPDVEPRYLELEVLETSALDDIAAVSATMNACIALGVNFALDDFGTGYSSLTHLRRLPANLIKIDQTFVRNMLIDADDLAIVEGVIALAKSFRRDVIAEGVETIEHGTALLKLGCELAQGYGIARPMPASDVPVWISEWKIDSDWKS
jgi:diguanylate cyclase (GGDEF)-like protein/PAS domain S-box-containing protein